MATKSEPLPQEHPFNPLNFLALPEKHSSFATSRVAVLPVPYDSTTSYKSGARDGPQAIIQASHQLEDYDPELGYEPYLVGIHTLTYLDPSMDSPLATHNRVYASVKSLLEAGKLPVLLGGEHSISIGAVKAMCEKYHDLSVLFLDAHADLRHEYMDTQWGHASTARRIWEMCPLVEVGVRSLSLEEAEFIKEKDVAVVSWDPPPAKDDWVEQVVDRLSSQVYLSIDLDVLDPALMPAVGTPEPGGLLWHQLLAILRRVGDTKTIAGFDVMELCPKEGPSSCAFTAARLVYKLIGYSFLTRRKGEA